MQSQRRTRLIVWLLVVAGFACLAAYSFRTHTVTYEMVWLTGARAPFATENANTDHEGNPKILLLRSLPDDEKNMCYLVTFSSPFLAYLESSQRPTVPVTFRVHYSYGKVFYSTIEKVGSYRDFRQLKFTTVIRGSDPCFR